MDSMEAPSEENVFVGETRFTAILRPDLEDGGYTVSCKEIPAAISQGETIEEALDNLVDALALCLETKAEVKASALAARSRQ